MKIWAYLAIVIIVVGAGGTAANKIHKSGYNKAVSEMQTDAIEAQNAAVQKRMDEWLATQKAAEPVIVIEEKIVEKIRVITKEVPKIVERFIQSDCRDLGPEYAGLLNAAVRASNSRSDTGAAATTELADSL